MTGLKYEFTIGIRVKHPTVMLFAQQVRTWEVGVQVIMSIKEGNSVTHPPLLDDSSGDVVEYEWTLPTKIVEDEITKQTNDVVKQ